MNRAILEFADINVDEALNRMMNNEDLLEKLFKKFLDQDYCSAIEQAIAVHDAEAAANAVHALKGVAGNLSFTRVFELSTNQCELFRAGSWDEAVALMQPLQEAVDEVRNAIEIAFV